MNLTRRSFLKTSALTGATAIGLLGCEEIPVLDTVVEERAPKPIGKLSQGVWVPSGCTGCTSWCTLQAYVVNGRVLKVRGNVNSKTNKKNNCPRMHLGIQQMYDPDRIKTPMKRTNPRKGRNEDPGFVPITWNEAINTIADKHAELIKNGEQHKFAFFRGRYTQNNELNYGRMVRLLGSPNNISHSSICAEAEKFGPMYTEGFGNYRDYDLDNTRYVLCWGMDPLCTNRQVSNWLNKWGDVLDRATVAVVEPRLTSTASKAHEWLPVKSGYDAPVALAMAHVLLTEGLWHRPFVGDFKDKVNKFVAGQDVAEDSFEEIHTLGLVKWWNLELKNRTPQWASQLSGIPVDQIVRVARGMGAAAPAVCVMMGGGAVMQVRGAYTSMAIHALAGILGASDNVGGSTQNPSAPEQALPANTAFNLSVPDSQKIDQRGYLEWPNLATGSTGVNLNRVADAILNEDPYDIKFAYAYWINTPYSCPDPIRWEKALAKVPFLVHHVVHFAEMSWYADIVLPSTHANYEQWGYLVQKQDLYRHAWLARPIDKPFPEARNPETEYVFMLAEKLAERGIPNLKDYIATIKDPETGKSATTPQELDLYTTKFRTELLWNPAKNTTGEKLSGWNEFVQRGVWNSNKYAYRSKWNNYATISKKFEFYSETLKDRLQKFADTVTKYKAKATIDEVIVASGYTATGELRFLPHYAEPVIAGNKAQYPLVFVDHKARLNREGRAANCSWYQEFHDVDFGDEKWGDTVKLNPADAAKAGIQHGDMVKVTSPSGSVTVKAFLWEGIVPGHAVKAYGQGHWFFGTNGTGIGGNNNDVIPAVYEHLSGSTVFYASTHVKVEKA